MDEIAGSSKAKADNKEPTKLGYFCLRHSGNILITNLTHFSSRDVGEPMDGGGLKELPENFHAGSNLNIECCRIGP